MKPNATALAVSLLSSVLLLDVQAATAQTTSPPGATATRPATTPPGQTSMPNESPPATTTQTTGEASRDPAVKKMNEDEKQGRYQRQVAPALAASKKGAAANIGWPPFAHLRSIPGRRNACQSLLDGEHPDAALRHVVLDTCIIVGRQRIVDALPVNTYAKSGCAAAP